MDFMITVACVLAFLYMVIKAGRKKKEKEAENAPAGGKGLKGLFAPRKTDAPGKQLPAPADPDVRKAKTFCKVLVFFSNLETDSEVFSDKVNARLACTLNELYEMDIYDFDIKLESFSDILIIFIEYRRPAA